MKNFHHPTAHWQLSKSITTVAIACVALLFFATNPSASAAQSGPTDRISFPYQAIVATNGAAIYSGPDEVHYATDKLQQGDVVSVHRHDPNGWCAVQPSPGSFSLVPEGAIDRVSEDVGVVTQNGVQAWVGTRLGSVDQPLWQIKLKQGEEVHVLGEASWPSPDGHSTIWYQIAPPAGEFRWVRMADLEVPGASSRELPDRRLAREDSQLDNISLQSNVSMETGKLGQDDRIADDLATPADPRDGNSGFQYLSEMKISPDAPAKVASNNSAAPRQRGTRSAEPQADVRDDEGLDFKFRPIGATATAAVAASIRTKSVSRGVTREPWDKDSVTGNPETGNHTTGNSEAGNDEIRQVAWQEDAPRSEVRTAVEGSFQRRTTRTEDTRRERAPANSPNQWKVGNARIASDAGRLPGVDRDSHVQSRLDDDELRKERGRPSSAIRGLDEIADWKFDDADSAEMMTTPVLVEWDGADSGQYDANDATYGSPVIRSTLSEKLTPRLVDIEMQLTNEMLKRPNEWQLADLELAVSQIYSQTKLPTERLQAQRIMDKVANCKRIRNGYAQSFHARGETFGTSLSPSIASTGRSKSGTASLTMSGAVSSPAATTVIGSGVNHDLEMGTKYDAHGWLTELVSEDRNNRPVYVLVDDEGKITHHVAATPGLNLHRYLKAKVGVNGRRGYNRVLDLSHVTAEAVSEIKRR